MQIVELEEWRQRAYHSAKLYKERTKRWHDRRIKPKEIKEGDKVLLFNSKVRLFRQGKLQRKWKGPYTVINTSSHSMITIQDGEGNISKVNGQQLKLFLKTLHKFEEEIDVIELIDFNAFH